MQLSTKIYPFSSVISNSLINDVSATVPKYINTPSQSIIVPSSNLTPVIYSSPRNSTTLLPAIILILSWLTLSLAARSAVILFLTTIVIVSANLLR
jgi:hypothetical protein